MLDMAFFKTALSCHCPKCGKGDLYPSRFNLTLNEHCSSCGLNLRENDSADGPAVFLIFFLGALLVPLALLFENLFAPPMWVHIILWSMAAIFLTLILLRPLKSYIIALQYKHRPGDWE
jgi:uncharacterized protein (DUF983 family)